MQKDRNNRTKWGIITSLILALALAGCGGVLEEMADAIDSGEENSADTDTSGGLGDLVQDIVSPLLGLEESPVEEFSYVYDADTQGVMITGYNGTAIKVVIPARIEGEPVTSISGVEISSDETQGAFQDSGIMSVYIPDTVKEIGRRAFYGCTGLTEITIPKGVTEIGWQAFSGCTGLTEITIPEGVTEIGDGAFSGCTGLTEITIPESVTEIGLSVFRDCTSLTSVTIPNSVTVIGLYAFSGCTGLTEITIPESVTIIGSGAFKDCTSLTEMTIPEGVTEIEYGTFMGCTGLTSVTIPEGVTKIGSVTGLRVSGAFTGCTSLTDINIPDSVTEIQMGAFRDCDNLPEETRQKILDINSGAF